MTLSKRLIVFSSFVVPIVVFDQITKVVARDALGGGKVYVYLDGWVRLQFAQNPGAFLGWGSSLPPAWRTVAFSVLPLILLALLAVSVLRSPSAGWAAVSGAALVFGGGVGNLIDRILFGGMVTDFMVLGSGRLRTGVFNLADVAITTGVFLIIFYHLWREPYKKVQL